MTGIAQEDGTRLYPSMKQIADSFNVSLSAVSHRAAEEKWAEERSDFQQRVYQDAVSLCENEFSRVLAKADLDSAIAASDLIHHIRRQIERATDQERTSMAKTLSKPLRELLGVVHAAVGIEQAIELDREGEAA